MSIQLRQPSVYSRTVTLTLDEVTPLNMFPIGNINPKTPIELGAAIRERRRQMKVTQKDLAMTCGTGLRFLIELERGKPTCQIGKVLQVLQALGLQLQLKSLSGPDGRGDAS